MNDRFVFGLIEGFYGRMWSWDDRMDWCRFLGAQKADFYLYAPKDDEHLRR